MDCPDKGYMNALPPELAAILAFNETGAQFFKRVHEERVLTGLPIIDDNLSLRPGVILEVVGPPGSGKTELLLSIALHVLLAPYARPAAWLAHPSASGVACGLPGSRLGHLASDLPPKPPEGSGQVVIFDLDGKFDGVRLMQVLEPQVQSVWRDQQHQQQQQSAVARVFYTNPTGHPTGGMGLLLPVPAAPQTHGGPGPQGGSLPYDSAVYNSLPYGGNLSAAPTHFDHLLNPDQVVSEVLSRLHLVSCHSTLQLLAALADLPKRLRAMQAAGTPCRLLLLDNVGAHFWRDRAAKNTTTPGSYHHHHHHQEQQQPLALSLHEIHTAVAARLLHTARRLRLPVIATKTAAVTVRLSESEGDGGVGAGRVGGAVGQLQQREFMPLGWQNIVTHRMLLHPGGVLPCPAVPRGPSAMTAAGPNRAVPRLTSIRVEMLGAVGQAAGGKEVPGVQGLVGAKPASGVGSGHRVARLLVSDVALVADADETREEGNATRRLVDREKA